MSKEKIIKKRKSDKIEKLGKSIIQHGKLNDRVILLSFNPNSVLLGSLYLFFQIIPLFF